MQLVCLGTEDAPDRKGRRASNADDFRRLMIEASREEEDWSGIEAG